jgi:hypothetical protein
MTILPPDHPLPGVPLIESPFFANLFADADPELTALATALVRDGFAVIDFPDREIATRAERIKRALAPRFDMAGFRAGREHSLRLQDAWQFKTDVRAIACNSQILHLLSRLYRRRAFPFQTLNFPFGSQQRAHSDSVHFSSYPERWMCGVWVALEEISEDNGPLVYYPASHRLPVLDNAALGIDPASLVSVYDRYPLFEDTWERMIAALDLKPRRFHARMGQALIWTANLLHGGEPHKNRNRTRWSQVTHYFFEGCGYYTPLGSDLFRGTILLREPFDITTGRTVKGTMLPKADSASALLFSSARKIARRLGLIRTCRRV